METTPATVVEVADEGCVVFPSIVEGEYHTGWDIECLKCGVVHTVSRAVGTEIVRNLVHVG